LRKNAPTEPGLTHVPPFCLEQQPTAPPLVFVDISQKAGFSCPDAGLRPEQWYRIFSPFIFWRIHFTYRVRALFGILPLDGVYLFLYNYNFYIKKIIC
jgi:hypothetical protein